MEAKSWQLGIPAKRAKIHFLNFFVFLEKMMQVILENTIIFAYSVWNRNKQQRHKINGERNIFFLTLVYFLDSICHKWWSNRLVCSLHFPSSLILSIINSLYAFKYDYLRVTLFIRLCVVWFNSQFYLLIDFDHCYWKFFKFYFNLLM